MVKTRSNLETNGPLPLPFDPNNIEGDGGNTKRARIAFNLFQDIATRWPSDEMKRFLFSKPGFEDGAEAEWIPVRPLGRGSRMKVALWKKVDATGAEIDYLVIKDSNIDPWLVALYSTGLVREAVYQGHLSAMKESRRNITQLRAYKFNPDNQSDPRADRARLYLRYAPHGTLEDVFYRYRALRTYLPESYLWSVLVDLANAITILRKCPTAWNPVLRNGQVPPDMDQDPEAFILHQDIKPENCFVGAPDPKANSRAAYCPAELGDFGSSEVRKPDSGAKLFFKSGTRGFAAPEQCSYGENWQDKIYNFYPGYFGIRETTNVWGVGQVLWHLMTLRSIREFPADFGFLLDSTKDPMNLPPPQQESNFYDAYTRHFMPHSECEHPAAKYSGKLEDLVYECLRPDFTERPSATNLLRQAKKGLKDSLRGTNKKDVQQVYFSNAAMNDHIQPPGDAPFVFSRAHQTDNFIFEGMIMQNPYHFPDPEDAPLKPRAGWHRFQIGALGPPTHPASAEYMHEYPLPLFQQPDYPQMGYLVSELQQGKLIGRKDVGFFQNEPLLPPKRARSWDPQDEADHEMRVLLRELRNKTQAYASGKSIRLLTCVLESEKFDVAAAEKVFKWLYKAGSANIRFPWSQKPLVQQQARNVMHKWQKRFNNMRPRTLRECMYFVINEAVGAARVDMAIKKMDFVFQPEDLEGPDVEQPQPLQVNSQIKDRNQRLREVMTVLRDLYERGIIPSHYHDPEEMARFLAANHGDVKATVARVRAQIECHARAFSRAHLRTAYWDRRRAAEKGRARKHDRMRAREVDVHLQDEADGMITDAYVYAEDDADGVVSSVDQTVFQWRNAERLRQRRADEAAGRHVLFGPADRVREPATTFIKEEWADYNEFEDDGPPGHRHRRDRQRDGAERWGEGAVGPGGALGFSQGDLDVQADQGMGFRQRDDEEVFRLQPDAYPQPVGLNAGVSASEANDFIPYQVERNGIVEHVFPGDQQPQRRPPGYFHPGLVDGSGDGRINQGDEGAEDAEQEQVASMTDDRRLYDDDEPTFEEADLGGGDDEGASAPAAATSKHMVRNDDNDDDYWARRKEELADERAEHEDEMLEQASDEFQHERRVELILKLRNKPVARLRRNSLGGGIGDRRDVSFGEVGRRERKRGEHEELFMSGGLGEEDREGMHRDEKYQQRVWEENMNNIEDHWGDRDLGVTGGNGDAEDGGEDDAIEEVYDTDETGENRENDGNEEDYSNGEDFLYGLEDDQELLSDDSEGEVFGYGGNEDEDWE